MNSKAWGQRPAASLLLAASRLWMPKSEVLMLVQQPQFHHRNERERHLLVRCCVIWWEFLMLRKETSSYNTLPKRCQYGTRKHSQWWLGPASVAQGTDNSDLEPKSTIIPWSPSSSSLSSISGWDSGLESTEPAFEVCSIKSSTYIDCH